MSRLGLALVVAAALGLPAAARGQADAEKLRAAKALYFDRQYAEAREAWQAVRAAGRGAEAQAALYWIARCSEGLGERERALAEYGEYLASRPSDRALAEEAKTSRVALAAKLYRAGQTRHLGVLKDALADLSQTVRYFAALQLGGLGRVVGQPAVPVLKEILAKEKDEDLVDRAKLILLRLDREALAEASPPPAPRRGAREASWIRVRIFEKGAAKPQVSINLPVALAAMVFKSLPDDARSELRRKGYDADTFWERLKKTGPTEILTIEGEDGERVQVWLE
jgi:tetratricopeptide (TPR) repeat protein